MDPVPPAPAQTAPQPQPVTPPPKPLIKTWVLMVGGVLLLGVGIVTGVFLGKQLYSIPQPVPTPLPTEASAKEGDPTANWKTYTYIPPENSFVKTQFSIKLPPNTEGQKLLCSQNGCWSVSMSLVNDLSLFAIEGGSKSYWSEPTWSGMEKYIRQSNQTYSLIPVSGREAFYLEVIGDFVPFENSVPESTRLGVVIPTKNDQWLSLFIAKTISTNGNTLSSEDKAIFDQILSTFKFTN